MRRIITLATAAATLAGAIAVSGPAAAQYRRGHNDHGDAVAAGVLGFALGTAVGGGADVRYRSDYYPQDRYYGRPRGYAYGYGYREPRRCAVENRWDPYRHRYYSVERCW